MLRSLSFDDQRRLVEAILRIDAMRVRRDRDLYLSLLEGELGHRLHFARHDRDQLDVLALVKTCLSCPGALHVLAGMLEKLQPGSLSVRALCDLVHELLPEPWLDQAERRALHQLITLLERSGAGLSYLSWFPALYWRAVGPAGPLLDREIRGLHDVVALVEDVPEGDDGVPPLLLFVGDLAEYCGGNTAPAFRDWVRRQARLQGLDSRLLQRHSEQAAMTTAKEPSDMYLIIECVPDAMEPNRYLVTAWLQVDREPGTTLRCDDQPLPLSGIPKLLERLLLADSPLFDQPNADLTIEFILPRDLLDYPVEQFKIDIAGFEHRIGIRYPVVVRSLDRMRLPAIRNGWRRKWSWVRENSVDAPVHLVQRPGQYDHEDLFSRLADTSPAVLALAFPPWGSRHENSDEHWVGILAGVPVIAWCRDGRDPARFAKEIKDLLAADVLTLPQRTMQLRRQALSHRSRERESPHGHLGLHLALVFDDADRIPEPYARLRPPA